MQHTICIPQLNAGVRPRQAPQTPLRLTISAEHLVARQHLAPLLRIFTDVPCLFGLVHVPEVEVHVPNSELSTPQ